MKKRVVVTQRVDSWPDRGEVRDALDQRLISFVAKCGALAFPAPNFLLSEDALGDWLEAVQPDAILLSGGNDIGQSMERDRTEQKLLSYAQSRCLPVLGICRGMQMMGVFAGEKLKTLGGHVRTTHNLSGEIEGTANSYHNQALTGCPVGYEILAVSDDGAVEAIGHIDLPWEGWMWHPEREQDFLLRDINRLKALLK